MDQIKSLAFDLLIGFALTIADLLLKATFLRQFLYSNLITILVALLAINITTISIIISKLNDLRNRDAASFPATIKQLRSSIVEQVIQIAVAVVALVAGSSQVLSKAMPYWETATTTLLSAVLVASLLNLYDTGKAVFILYNYEKKN
jgi:hypothetical protein